MNKNYQKFGYPFVNMNWHHILLLLQFQNPQLIKFILKNLKMKNSMKLVNK